MKILIIEDKKETREYVKKLIEDKIKGISVFAVESSMDGLWISKKEGPDIVISDLSLGEGREGWERLLEILDRQLRKGKRVFLHSGATDVDPELTKHKNVKFFYKDIRSIKKMVEEVEKIASNEKYTEKKSERFKKSRKPEQHIETAVDLIEKAKFKNSVIFEISRLKELKKRLKKMTLANQKAKIEGPYSKKDLEKVLMQIKKIESKMEKISKEKKLDSLRELKKRNFKRRL